MTSAPASRPPVVPPRPTHPPRVHFAGEDSPLVRPYLVAHERRRAEVRGRRTLWLAVHGVDIAPPAARGTEAAA
ncbi:hypothetical protein [Streptomyces somaliensis]|nr:hypothetical protein [Streptomyces somaliensis]